MTLEGGRIGRVAASERKRASLKTEYLGSLQFALLTKTLSVILDRERRAYGASVSVWRVSLPTSVPGKAVGVTLFLRG